MIFFLCVTQGPHEAFRKNTPSSHLSHVARAFVISFTDEHCFTFHSVHFLSSRLSTRQSSRRLLMSASYGDHTFADSSNVSFGPMPTSTSPSESREQTWTCQSPHQRQRVFSSANDAPQQKGTNPGTASASTTAVDTKKRRIEDEG